MAALLLIAGMVALPVVREIWQEAKDRIEHGSPNDYEEHLQARTVNELSTAQGT